jgi:hypothetical protein
MTDLCEQIHDAPARTAGTPSVAPFIRDRATVGSGTVVTVLLTVLLAALLATALTSAVVLARGTHALTRRRCSALFGLLPLGCPAVAPRSERPAVLGHFRRP